MASFLDLPHALRRRIYLQAGVPVKADIILRPRGFRRGDVHTQCNLAYNLLQTRRAVHDEVADIIYAENRFIASGQYGFYHLQLLSPRACATLTSLTIHLCVKARELFGPEWIDDVAPLPLRTGCIEAWQEAAAYFLAHTNPEALDLLLICDTGYSGDTTGALQPLVDHTGSVKRCQIRLGHGQDRQLCSLARDVALRAQRPPPDEDENDDKPFRFMDLPPEIRLQILEHTDLMTPLGQVEWRADRGYNAVWNRPTRCSTGGERERDAWLTFNPCLVDRDTRHTGVVCSVRDIGYTSRCQCWKPPGADIMLVSRAMYRMAMTTLYGRNRVIVLPGRDDITALLDSPSTGLSDSDESDEADGSDNESDNESGLWEVELFHRDGTVSVIEPARPPLEQRQLGATVFLGAHHRILQGTALSYLRALEIVFPAKGVGRWTPAVRHLRAQGVVKSLTLIVHMRVASRSLDTNTRVLVGGINGRAAFEQTLVWTDDPLQNHAALLEPLRELREAGLRRLFVFIESEWHWSPPQGCSLYTCERVQSGLFHDCVRDMEQVLERSVMGQEYDSTKEGKMRERPSQWMLREIYLD
ncbi:hypothetical protein PG985_010307 [Apiospora marii]|uniref:uncharacterized protein n=1 Tax=Apiospora marii TaxID=335849 RepID=UPI00312D4E43